MSKLDFSTVKYQNENEYILSLPRVVFKTEKARICVQESVCWLIYQKLYTLLYLKNYFIELLSGWRFLVDTLHLKDSKVYQDALVIGNGPSQGFLTADLLLRFRKGGGEIFAVNFWTENLLLSQVNPDYLVISDDATLSMESLNHLAEKNERLLNYLKQHKNIKIICPIRRCGELMVTFGRWRVIGFVDSELRLWTKNINPLFPRGYLSMTLYKALAFSIWFGYKDVYVIGMDNTYPRNLYCDMDNKVINHEVHAADEDFAVDQTDLYLNIGNALSDISKVFMDLYRFPAMRITNLDSYSLTDAFKKIKFSEWLR